MKLEFKVAFADFFLSIIFYFVTGYREIDLSSYI